MVSCAYVSALAFLLRLSSSCSCFFKYFLLFSGFGELFFFNCNFHFSLIRGFICSRLFFRLDDWFQLFFSNYFDRLQVSGLVIQIRKSVARSANISESGRSQLWGKERKEEEKSSSSRRNAIRFVCELCLLYYNRSVPNFCSFRPFSLPLWCQNFCGALVSLAFILRCLGHMPTSLPPSIYC